MIYAVSAAREPIQEVTATGVSYSREPHPDEGEAIALALDGMVKRLAAAMHGEAAIEKVAVQLGGEETIQFAGVEAESYHMVACKLCFMVRQEIDRANERLAAYPPPWPPRLLWEAIREQLHNLPSFDFPYLVERIHFEHNRAIRRGAVGAGGAATTVHAGPGIIWYHGQRSYSADGCASHRRVCRAAPRPKRVPGP